MVYCISIPFRINTDVLWLMAKIYANDSPNRLMMPKSLVSNRFARIFWKSLTYWVMPPTPYPRINWTKTMRTWRICTMDLWWRAIHWDKCSSGMVLSLSIQWMKSLIQTYTRHYSKRYRLPFCTPLIYSSPYRFHLNVLLVFHPSLPFHSRPMANITGSKRRRCGCRCGSNKNWLQTTREMHKTGIGWCFT